MPAAPLPPRLSFPVVSFGLQVYDDGTATQLTTMALGVGFRNFFSSVLAGNQQGFGAAIKATSVPRSEIFICGSVNTGSGACSGTADCKTQTAAGCQTNLQDIGVDYLDMSEFVSSVRPRSHRWHARSPLRRAYRRAHRSTESLAPARLRRSLPRSTVMLDYPAGDCPSIVGQWAAFEEMLAANKTRSIAVSNFSPTQLDCILANKTATVPAVNQLPYSVGHGGDSSVSDDAKRGGTIVQAYSPLDSGSLASDPDCASIGKKHGKSAAQVALKWILQRNATFSTQTDSKQYFQEDIDLFDFELTTAEMAKLNAK